MFLKVKCVPGLLLACLSVFAVAQTSSGQPQTVADSSAGAHSLVRPERQSAISAYGRLPLSFEPAQGQGQTNRAADFVARGQGYTLSLNPSTTTLSLHRPRPAGGRDRREREREEAGGALAPITPPIALQLRLLGANVSAEAVPENLLPGKSNYLIGNDRSQWRTNVANYARVRYHSVYPGIDVVYYGNQRRLEHDFEVSPGADPRKIRLAFDGANSVEIAASGDLVLHVADGEVRLHKPLIYQQTPQGKREIAGGFVLGKKQEVSIRVADYDPNTPLIIDPVLGYSTYLGGSSNDYAYGIAVDSGGNAYLTGSTTSVDFPGALASFSTSCPGCGQVFVTKLNPTGTGTVYSTYFGSGFAYGYAIAVDASGNAYVTGETSAPNFPLAGSPFQSTLNGIYNAFVSVLNPTGTGLRYSTLLGGSAYDDGLAIALDGGTSPNIYITGLSFSSDFPIVGAAISTPPPVLYHSSNGASSWSGSADFKSLQVSAVAVDGGTAETVYAAGYGLGLYKSTDSGSTWAPTALTRSFINAHALVIDPTTSGTSATLYAGLGTSSIERLTDGGATLAVLNVGACCVSALALNPNNAAQLYVGTSSQGVWVSSDANVLPPATPTFIQLATSGLIISPSTTPATINALVVDKNTSELYAATSQGVFHFAGGPWSAFSTGLVGTYVYSLVEDANSNLYAATSSGLFRTSTAGAAWVAINGSGSSALPTGSTNIALDPLVAGTIYAGGANGLFKTTNGGATWTPSNSGLQPKRVTVIAVDPANSLNLYVGMENIMAFVAKFSAAGAPIYSSQYGGLGDTYAYGAAADSSGNFYVGGNTSATGIPGPLVEQTTPPSTNTGFLVKLNSSGAVVYDRYLGGTAADYVYGVAVDGSANVYLTGESDSTDFPVIPSSAYQSTNKSQGTAFLTKIDPNGANRLYSTFLGGTNYEYGNAVALVGTNGRVAIAGATYSTDFPTVNAKQPFLAALGDGFYAQLDTTLSGPASLLYSTYLGGNSYDEAYALAIDSAGSAYIAGSTSSTDFPVTTGALQTTLAGTTGLYDAFVTKFQSAGNSSDLATTITPSAATVAVGQNYTYTITVTNNGPSALGAPNVSIFDALPSTVTLLNVAGNLSTGGAFPCTGSGAGARVQCNVGTLPLGVSAIATLTVFATITPPPASVDVANTAFATTDDDDPDPTNNSATTSVTVQVQADLLVSNATAEQQASGYSPTTLLDRTQTTDLFNIANNGPGNATSVIVSIPVPAGVTFNGSGNSTPCTLSGSTVTCSMGTLASGATSPILFVWTPTAPGPVTIKATVSSSQAIDTHSLNDSASWTTTVAPAVDLSITAAPSSVNVPVGGSAAIELTIRNLGTDTATSQTVTTALPAGMSYVSFSSSSTGVSCGVEGSVFCSLPDLAPNASITVTIFATAVLQGNYSATASVSFSGTDTNTSNDNATTQVTFAGALNSALTTLLTDYEASTVRAFTGYPNPFSIFAQPILAGANPDYIVIAPNGRLAFVANINGSYISVIDLTIQAEIARIRDLSAWSLAITSDGQKLVSVGYNRDELDIVDIATFAVTRISLDGRVGDSAGVNDIHPFAVTVVGSRAYIANELKPVISVDFTTLPGPATITAIANTAALISLPAGHHLAATPDGGTIAVFGVPRAGGNAVVYLIATSTNTSTTVTTTFAGSRSLAITPSANAGTGVLAFLAHGATIDTLDLRATSATYRQLLPSATLTLPTAIADMALTPDGGTLQAISGPSQGLTGSSTLYTLNANAFLSSPSIALLSTVTIPGAISTRGIAIGYVQNSPLAGAPQVLDVVPTEITNETAKTVTIFGDNFAPGALVRIGNLEPLSSAFVSQQQITVTIPAAAAVQLANIVVTLPNSAAGPLSANVSGSGSNNNLTLRISPPPTFAPVHPVAVSSFSTDNLALLFRESNFLPAAPETYSLAISTDGLFAYTGIWEFTATNLDSQIREVTSVFPSDPAGGFTGPGGDGIAIAPDPVLNKQAAYFVSTGPLNHDTLHIVDVDPASTTTRYSQRIVQAAPTDFSFAEALAATPDGRFVYSVDVNSTNGGTRLVIFDVLNGTSTVIPDITTLGADPYQGHIQVTPDGHSLLLSGPGGASIKVYDIQGTNALAPVLVATITGSGALTTNPPLLYWFQVVGTASPRLYAYASDQRYIQVFNFDRATPNFASLGSYTIPGALAGAFAGSAMAVTPEGTLIYAVLENEDAVAVLDAQAITSDTGNPLITKMRTPVNPSNLAISPRTNASADLFATVSTSAPHITEAGLALAGVGQPFDVIIGVQNNGPATATGVTMTLDIPAGIVVHSAVITYGLASFTCSIEPARVSCPVGNWHVGDLVNVDVNVSATALGAYTFTNTVAGNELDPSPANNAANLDVSVPVTADVSVTVSASPNPVALGQPVTLTATITNNGPAVATAAIGSLVFPIVSAGEPPVYSASQGTCSTFGTCSLGDLASGAYATITATTTFTATIVGVAATDVPISGTASSSTADPNTGNNSFTLNLPLSNSATPVQRWLVADRATGQITIIDSATNTPLGHTIPTGVSPSAIAISPNRHIAFVANLNATYISVVDLSIQQEIYRIRFGDAGVRNIALTPDGSRLVAMLANTPKLLIIDAVTFQLLQSVDLTPQFSDLAPGKPILIGLAVTGHQAYVAAASSGSIAVVDTNTFSATNVSGVTGTATLFAGNSTMAVTPDGLNVVAVRQNPNSLQIISTAANSVVNTVTSTAIFPNTKIAIGARTSAPLGTYGYFGTNVINVVNLTPGPSFGQIVGLTDSLSFPATDLAVSPDGSRLYAITTSNFPANNAAVVDTGALLSDSASVVFQGRFGGMCISTNSCPVSLRAVAAGYVDTLPIAGAPVISGVTPIIVLNDTPTTITISGSGFASDARVLVGKTNLPVTFISDSELQVDIPAGAPAHGRDIIVTNPNVAAAPAGQLLSAFLRGGTDGRGLEIISPITYQPKFQAVVSELGAGTIDFLRQSGGGSGNQIFVGPDPLGTSFSPDGSEFYAESISIASVTAGSPQCCQNTLIGLSGSPGQDEGIATAVNPDTGKPAVFVSSQTPTPSPDVQLNVIDADPFSPAVNSILYTIPAHLGSSVVAGGLAVTSDGRFVYQILADGRLVIFDVAARGVTIIPAGTLGNLFFNRALVSSDGHTLLIIDSTGNSSVKAFDISNNPLSPTLLTTINPFVPSGTASMFMDSLALVGNHLYAYDSLQRIVEVFNFNRATENTTFVNYFIVPGSTPAANGYIAGLAVTPDEALLYASNREDDSVAVIDNVKLLAGVQGDPTMLLTAIATAQGPTSIVISPKRLDAAPMDVAIAITHAPNPVLLGSNVAFDFTLTNNGPFTSSGNPQSGNSGFLINFDKSLVPISSTLATSPFLTCTFSATQLLCGFSNVGLGAPPVSISGNILFQTTAVGTFSATGYIDGGAYDPDTTNNVATDAADVVAAVADVAVTMTALPSPVAVLGSVTYQITLTNNGPSPATGLVLTDTLPVGTLFASIDDLTDCALSNRVLTCNFASLGAGSSTAVNLILVPLTVPSDAGTFNNTATVAASEPDPALSNNSATQTVQVTGANLSGGGALRNLAGFSNTITPPNDDDSFGPVPLGFNVNFFGVQVSSLFVNNNGNVTFGSSLGTYTPFPLTTTNLQIIAPYFSDVETDVAGSGLATYGADTVNGRPAFGVNWPNVTYYGEATASLLDLFQLVLVDRSDVNPGDFDIEFNYDKMQWETGDASDGVNGLGGSSARVGYSNGTGTTGSYFELPGSGVPGSFLDNNTATGLIYNTLNSTQPGRYVFQVRGGAVQSSADLALTATGPQFAAAGSTIIYALAAANHGPNTATGVTVTNTLPVGLSFVAATPGTICPTPPIPAAGQPVVVTCNVGSIASGSTVDIAIQATIAPAVSGSLTNTAVISVPNYQDLNLGNNAATAVTDTNVADLAVSMSPSATQVAPGSNLAYTITVTNNGPSASTGYTLTDTLPSIVGFVSAAGCSFSTGVVTCTGSSLNAGQSANYLVVVTPTAPGTVSNTATVAGTEHDLVAGNDSATVTVTAIVVDLAVTVTAAPTIVAPGSNLTYTITVTNGGPSASTGYTLTHTLPSNVTFVSATAGCALSTVLTCNGSALGVGQSAVYAVVVTPTAQAALTSTVTVAGNEPDPLPSNNTMILLNSAAAADIVVSAAGATSPVGGSPAYAATVTNNGPSDATNIVATATLDRFTYVNAFAGNGAPCTFSAPVVSCNLGALAKDANVIVTAVVISPNGGWAAITFHATAAQPDPNPINNAVRLGPALDSFNTPVGSGVAVNVSDAADNVTAALTFNNVTRTGSTTVNPLSVSSLPPGFRTGRQPIVFDISTNAEFTGAIGLTIRFVPSNFRHPALVRLFHYEAGAWVDRTAGLDAASGAIAGRVLSLSPFALLEPQDTIPVANAGLDRSVPGVMAAGARVALDGSASADADGDALTYRWTGPFPEGGGVVTGVNPSVSLPLGVSRVSLVVNDGEADSPAVAVNIAVADFHLSAPSGSITLTRGQSTTFTIASTPQYGAFAAPVSLSCAPSAPDVTCSFSTASITPGASGATATLTVTAASTIATVPHISPFLGDVGRSAPRQLALWLGTLPLFGIVFVAAGRRRKLQMAVLLMLLLVLVAMHVGCGGGGATQTQASSSPTTPGAKAVSVIVTGTSGTLQHTSTVTVTIPQ